MNLDEYETMKTQLSLVKRGLNKINVPWAIFAGAAAHCYGSKRQLADIDILVENDNFDMAKAVVKEAGTEKIDVIAKLKIETCQGSYFFFVDDEMIKRIRRKYIFDILVPVISVEDNIAFKAIAQRGEDQGKHDLADIQCMIENQRIDLEYLKRRIEKCQADERTRTFLERLIPGFGLL